MKTMEKNRLTQKQETFCIKYFELGNATEAALVAGYSRKVARSIGSENLTKPDIQSRIQELRERVEDASITSVLERKQILAEIARGRLADFVEVGADGAWFNIEPEAMNSRALASATSKTIVGKDGADDAVFIRVGLHNPIQAIAELNKMEGIYEAGNVTNINNRIVNIKVMYDGSNGTRVYRSLAEAT